MVKTTEGVIISSSQVGSGTHLPNHIAQHLPQVNADLNSLPKITRQLFVDDIQKAVGDLQVSLPLGLNAVLKELLLEANAYLNDGDEQHFMECCQTTIEQCSQGWSYLSYWASTEQSLCYSIYWGLRAAVEKHQKQMTMYLGSKNDGLPKNDSDPPFSPDPKVASLKDWLSKNRKREISQSDQSLLSYAFLRVLGDKARCTQEHLMQQYQSQEPDTLDQYALAQKQITQIIDNKEAKQKA